MRGRHVRANAIDSLGLALAERRKPLPLVASRRGLYLCSRFYVTEVGVDFPLAISFVKPQHACHLSLNSPSFGRSIADGQGLVRHGVMLLCNLRASSDQLPATSLAFGWSDGQSLISVTSYMRFHMYTIIKEHKRVGVSHPRDSHHFS